MLKAALSGFGLVHVPQELAERDIATGVPQEGVGGLVRTVFGLLSHPIRQARQKLPRFRLPRRSYRLVDLMSRGPR